MDEKNIVEKKKYSPMDDLKWNLELLGKIKKYEYLQIENNNILSYLSYNLITDIESDRYDELWETCKLCLTDIFDKFEESDKTDKLKELYDQSKQGLLKLKTAYRSGESRLWLNNFIASRFSI